MARRSVPPPRPTEVCNQTFNNTTQYQNAFDNLGHTDTGWVTADGFVPVSLPDGRTSWWMGDTMTGTAQPAPDNAVPNAGNVHNTVVLQNGTCLTPKFAAPMIPDSGATWYWPTSGVVKGNTLAVFAYHLEPASGPPGFDWAVRGTVVARFALPSLQLLGPPTDMPAIPTAEPPYGGGAVPWGTHSFLNAADGKVYVYGTTRRGGPFPATDAWVARAPFEDLSSLEYFTNPLLPTSPSWSGNLADAKPMTLNKNSLPDGSPIAQLTSSRTGIDFSSARSKPTSSRTSRAAASSGGGRPIRRRGRGRWCSPATGNRRVSRPSSAGPRTRSPTARASLRCLGWLAGPSSIA